MNTGIVSMAGSQVDSAPARPAVPAGGIAQATGESASPPAPGAARDVAARQAPDPATRGVPGEAKEAPDAKALEEAVERLNTFQKEQTRHHLTFEVDKDSGRTVISVVDSETQEIIRQIPPKEVMGLARRLADGVVPSLLSAQA